MTLLVTSIAAGSLSELRARVERAWTGGTDAVEIRIDHFSDDAGALAAYLKRHRDRTWIITCRSAREGGAATEDAGARCRLLASIVGDSGAMIDFEYADWKRCEEVRRMIESLLTESDQKRTCLILSTHDVDGSGGDPASWVEAMAASGGAVVKVAYRASNICDSFAALDLMHRHGRGVVAIAMGEPGRWTRVPASKLGAFATYCALDDESATAEGQLTLGDMTQRFACGVINAATEVYGVIGDPVAHSLSPALFGRWFADAGLNAIYLPLRVDVAGDTLDRFLTGCRERPWLGVTGLSVTMPHKSEALRWVGDSADGMAQRIGALNTLVFRDGKVSGYNTDGAAALASVTGALGCAREDLAGMRVDVLGTGGAARAVVAALSDAGCVVTVYGRSLDRTKALTDRFNGTPAAWDDRIRRSGEVLIQCTSVGLWPDVTVSPMPSTALDGCRLVFDVVYNPIETRLLHDAAAAGARTVGGLDMFLHQAAKQFELWTGRTPDRAAGREVLRLELQAR